MSATSMTVSIRRDKKVVASVTLTKGCEPVLVGRSSECVLRLPSDDFSASSVHAKIYWKGSSLMIEDAGSRNGVFLDGRPIGRPVKMTSGALFAVGGSLISATAEKKRKSVRAHQYHRLEFLNGDSAGRMVDIVPRQEGKEFDIGLDPKCSIHLGDLLVSRRHAVLTTNDSGECWIEDLGSRNGTFVNGERLSGKSRLLRDGDVISVAFFEFRFLDRNVAHTRVQVWFKLAVIVVTGCVMSMGYIAWVASRESVAVCLADARQKAAEGDFKGAREAVKTSRSARDASDFRQQINDLSGQIEAWDKTCEAWEEVRRDISQNRLGRARATLDALISGPVEAWGWNPENMTEIKADAELAARALHLYSDGKATVDSAGNDANMNADMQVRMLIGPIESFLREQGDVAAARPYMGGVMKLLEGLLADLRTIRSGYDKIDESIGKISATTPDFSSIYEDFDNIAGDESQSSAVRGYARQQLVTCRAFVQAQRFLDEELSSLVKLDFDGVRKMADQIRLPNQDLCIRHVKYSDARASFAERHRQLQHEAAALQLMIEGLSAAGVTESQYGEDIGLFLKRENLIQALGFDCLSRRPPNVRRPAPVGMYDTLFGIEYTFESLRALPNAFNGRDVRTMGFLPRCVAARQAFNRVEALVQYLDDNREYLQSGALGRYYAQCVSITNGRELLVQWLKNYKGAERGEIVASFYADFFSSRPMEPAKRLLRDRFSKLRQNVIALNERYTLETDPDRQLEIRDQILSAGIPGDPELHAKWAQKFD